MKSKTRYDVNICGGDFLNVAKSFRNWRKESHIYRKNRQMFEGKGEVRPLGVRAFDNSEAARLKLEGTCQPKDPYALAAEVADDGLRIWIVMAAYDE